MREQSVNDESLHPVLANLPVFVPEADLWSRIVSARGGPRAQRRRRWPFAIGIAAAIAVAAILVRPDLSMQNVAPDSGLVSGQRESQTLEREWQALPVANARPAAGLARLHMIDSALQAAYDRGAPADELQPLWQQRNEALRGLILSTRVDAITRI